MRNQFTFTYLTTTLELDCKGVNTQELLGKIGIFNLLFLQVVYGTTTTLISNRNYVVLVQAVLLLDD